MTGLLLGLLAGTGLWVAVLASPPLRRPTLDDRLRPHLRDAPRASRLLTDPQRGVPPSGLHRSLRPVVAEAVRVLDRLLGGVASAQRRLDQAGGRLTLPEFRVEQVVWGGAGLVAGLAGSLLLLARGADPAAAVVLVLLAAVGGVLGRDRWLSREVRQREERMTAEFPTVAELLAMAVTAGEGPVGALERVTRTSDGELAAELRRALADARAGANLVQALERTAARTSLPALARFVDGIAVAVERGTPLADVLRAQAVDVREAGKRQLLESAGRREIAMMVPVVFLVMPVTVLFALFPGFIGLSLTTG